MPKKKQKDAGTLLMGFLAFVVIEVLKQHLQREAARRTNAYFEKKQWQDAEIVE
jgi:hypothetical protein